MTTRYAKLFTVQTIHDYYNNRVSEDLVYRPTEESSAIIKGNRLLAKNTTGGITFLVPVDGNTPPNLAFPFTDDPGWKVTLRIQQKNPFFLNFSDLPLTKPVVDYLDLVKTAYYFTNRNTNPHSLSDPALDMKLLSVAPGNPVSDMDLVVLLPKVFKVFFNTPTDNFGLELRDWSNSLVTSVNVSESFDFANYKIEWGNIPSGFYTISLNGSPAQRIYLDDNIYYRPPFGIIDIFHTTEVDNSYRFAVDGGGGDVELVTQAYHLYFDNRETFWRYLFTEDVDDISLNMTGGSFTKDEPGRRFESNAAIPLREQYQLVEMDRDGDVFNLPNPTTQVIKPDPVLNRVYSEIYL